MEPDARDIDAWPPDRLEGNALAGTYRRDSRQTGRGPVCGGRAAAARRPLRHERRRIRPVSVRDAWRFSSSEDYSADRRVRVEQTD